MKKFIKELLTNRFGIVLATLNICYLVSRKFVYFTFSHGNQDQCVFYNQSVFYWIQIQFAEKILCLNFPAILAFLIPNEITRIVFSDFCLFTRAKFQIVLLTFFIVLQWLFIGWLSEKIAQKINRYSER
ncbi:hypothetical protein BH20ACI4_BH20ACI4_10260 [soil metagenome]